MGLPQLMPKTLQAAVPNAAAAYGAGDVVGGLITLDARNPENRLARGFIDRAVIVDTNARKAALSLYLFDAPPSAIADNAAFNTGLVPADVSKLLCPPLAISTYATYNTATVRGEAVFESALGYPLGFSVERYLYAYLVCTGTPTFTAANALHLYLPSSVY